MSNAKSVEALDLPFNLKKFNSEESRSAAFDYLCDTLTSTVTTRRVRDRIYILSTLEPAQDYKGNLQLWLSKAFGLTGAITENINHGDKLYAISTGKWVIEVQPLTKCLTMRISHMTKIRHGL